MFQHIFTSRKMPERPPHLFIIALFIDPNYLVYPTFILWPLDRPFRRQWAPKHLGHVLGGEGKKVIRVDMWHPPPLMKNTYEYLIIYMRKICYEDIKK